MGVTLLRAGPCAGKTTALVQRVARAVNEQHIPWPRVLFVVHDGIAARRVREALDAAIGRPLPIAVLTYEQLSQQILEQSYGYWHRALLSPVAERLAVAAAIAATHGSARRFRERGRETTPDDDAVRTSPRFRDDVADFIAELKRCKLDTATFRHHIIADLPQQDELLDIADIYQAYQKRLEEEAMFDYRGVIWLALLALETEGELSRQWRQQYELIVADDLQDASALQLELLVALLSEQAELFAAYEPAQCIYRFRGAVGDPAAVLTALAQDHEVRIEELLPAGRTSKAADTDCGTLARRFARSTGLDSASPGASLQAAQAELCIYQTLDEELVAVGDRIIASLQAGRRPDQIAVIARQHQQVILARRALAARNIPVAGERGRLARWAARRLIEDILAVHEYIRRRATLPVAVREQRRIQANAAAQRIVTFGGAPQGRAIAIADCVVKANRRKMFVLDEGVGERVGADDSDFAWLREVMDISQTASPVELLRRTFEHGGFGGRWVGQEADELMAACIGILEKLREADAALRRMASRSLTSEEVRAALEMVQEPTAEDDGVMVLTAHEARGRHFEEVFVIAVNDDGFPAPPVVSRLLASTTMNALRQRVAEHLGLETRLLNFAGFGEEPREALSEEQRIFYLCLTRAKKKLVVSCHLEEDGNQAAPSEFFLDLASNEMRAQIARTAAQASRKVDCPLADEAAADAEGLCAHEGCIVSWCARRDGAWEQAGRPLTAETTPHRHKAGPVLQGFAADFVLSSSSLRDYQRCPRRFFLGRLLGIPEPETDNLVYGQAIHNFLKRLYQVPPAERDDKAADLLEEALASQEDEFSSPTAFHIYRQRAHRALEDFAATPQFLEQAIALEEAFCLELPDEAGVKHRFAGRIDAVVRDSEGRLVIVDHKTGSLQQTPNAARLLRQFVARDPKHLAAEHRRHWEHEPEHPDYQLPLYAVAWEQLHPKQRVAAVAYQRFFWGSGRSCERIVVGVTDDEKGDEETVSRAELRHIAAALGRLAREIKERDSFEGVPPKEGCTRSDWGCPFWPYCEKFEFS